jgi:hypothetical protein
MNTATTNRTANTDSALTVHERTVPSGDGLGRLRRRSSQIWFDVCAGNRVLATWPKESQARAHASGLPVVERRGGLLIVWLGSLSAALTRADFGEQFDSEGFAPMSAAAEDRLAVDRRA